MTIGGIVWLAALAQVMCPLCQDEQYQTFLVFLFLPSALATFGGQGFRGMLLLSTLYICDGLLNKLWVLKCVVQQRKILINCFLLRCIHTNMSGTVSLPQQYISLTDFPKYIATSPCWLRMIWETLYPLQLIVQCLARPDYSITKFSTLIWKVSKIAFLFRTKVWPQPRLYTLNHFTTSDTVVECSLMNSVLPCCITHRLTCHNCLQCSFHTVVTPCLAFFQPTLPHTQDSRCGFGPFPGSNGLLMRHGPHKQLWNKQMKDSINTNLS